MDLALNQQFNTAFGKDNLRLEQNSPFGFEANFWKIIKKDFGKKQSSLKKKKNPFFIFSC